MPRSSASSAYPSDEEEASDDDYSSEYSLPSHASDKDGLSNGGAGAGARGGAAAGEPGRDPFVGIPLRPSDTRHRRHMPSMAPDHPTMVIPSSASASALSFRVLVDVFEAEKDTRTLIVSVAPIDTIRHLKETIEAQDGIPVHLQRIVYAGEQLENGRHVTFDPNASAASVGDGYQIRPGDTCTLVVLPGSESSSPRMSASPRLGSLQRRQGERMPGIISTPTRMSASTTTTATTTFRRTKQKRSLHVRSKSTVNEILGGSLTPAWAIPRAGGNRFGGPVTKPPDNYRMPGCSDSTLVQSQKRRSCRVPWSAAGCTHTFSTGSGKFPGLRARSATGRPRTVALPVWPASWVSRRRTWSGETLCVASFCLHTFLSIWRTKNAFCAICCCMPRM